MVNDDKKKKLTDIINMAYEAVCESSFGPNHYYISDDNSAKRVSFSEIGIKDGISVYSHDTSKRVYTNTVSIEITKMVIMAQLGFRIKDDISGDGWRGE